MLRALEGVVEDFAEGGDGLGDRGGLAVEDEAGRGAKAEGGGFAGVILDYLEAGGVIQGTSVGRTRVYDLTDGALTFTLPPVPKGKP